MLNADEEKSMLSTTNKEPELDLRDRLEWSNNQHCPHGTIRHLLGQPTAAAMLDYVAQQESAFRSGLVRSRGSDERRVDPAVLRSRVLLGLGPFQTDFETVMRAIAPLAVQRLGLIEPAVAPREFEFASYGDGGHFKVHLDTVDRSARVRILSCVYYFAATPPRFAGGNLRLHGFPDPFGRSERPIVDVTPETDMLVMFPSWMEHEVLPVAVPSGAWRDHRFSVNCWIHRVAPRAGPAA
jgi:SM-20-related protein